VQAHRREHPVKLGQRRLERADLRRGRIRRGADLGERLAEFGAADFELVERGIGRFRRGDELVEVGFKDRGNSYDATLPFRVFIQHLDHHLILVFV
jgi:hypothetical protein